MLDFRARLTVSSRLKTKQILAEIKCEGTVDIPIGAHSLGAFQATFFMQIPIRQFLQCQERTGSKFLRADFKPEKAE
jgi:hypothetical protein